MEDKRKVIVGFSGGATSAWCAGWALEKFPAGEVVLLWHDTKEEDPDTYRFLREMAARLGQPIVEQSDGRSVTEVCEDEGFLANNRVPLCSRILKGQQKDIYFARLREAGVTEIINVLGFTAKEPDRILRATLKAEQDGYTARFPLVECKLDKQHCIDWCYKQGVCPPRMYSWSEHANCLGCLRGGKAYWLKVKDHAPEVFKQRAQMEQDFGKTILKDTSLVDLAATGLKRSVSPRESVTLDESCGCGM